MLCCAWLLSHIRLFVTPWIVACQALLPMESSRPNTGVCSHALFQGTSQPRDQTWVSYIAGRFFTIWDVREAQFSSVELLSPV